MNSAKFLIREGAMPATIQTAWNLIIVEPDEDRLRQLSTHIENRARIRQEIIQVHGASAVTRVYRLLEKIPVFAISIRDTTWDSRNDASEIWGELDALFSTCDNMSVPVILMTGTPERDLCFQLRKRGIDTRPNAVVPPHNLAHWGDVVFGYLLHPIRR